MKHKGIIIGSALIAILLTVAAFTVLNKRWWKRMIDKRWPHQLKPDPGGPHGFAFRMWKPLKEYTLAQLMRWYFQGDQYWFRTDADYMAWNNRYTSERDGPGYQSDVQP